MQRSMIGQLAEFDQAKDSVTTYVERAQLFFEANDIHQEKQVAVLLSAIGARTYKFLRDLLAPMPPKDKSFDKIVAELWKHFEPKPLIIAEWFQFHCQQQAVGETVAEFVVELRRLAKHCEFETYLDEALRDRFVLWFAKRSSSEEAADGGQSDLCSGDGDCKESQNSEGKCSQAAKP